MNDTSGQTISVARGTKTRRRAAVACTHCNSRRLKCDVTISGPPCSRCRLLDGTTECVIYQSRRGKYQQYGTTILYIGNPLHNLAYTIYQRGQSGHHHRLHYPVIDNAALRTIPLGNAHEHGIIDLPRKEVQDELIKTYFSCVQPAYPFLDRVQFAQLYVQRNHSIVASSTSLSIMLLQAVFMVAFTHCPSSVLHQAGFQSRGDAKRTYFERAKLLWDSGQEIDRVVNIQVLLLLQFWWGSPTEQRDSTFWLNAAISLAQGCGMHRCTAQSGLAENERRLWKRIWMCLRMRDEQLAAAYGRPLHIAGDDCDLLPLDESDFLEEGVECIDEELFGRSKRLHYLYFLSMSRLGNIGWYPLSPSPSFFFYPLFG
ncbi:hypothetical protein K469DRAFT_673123 [Zopfia rhizophila CBS 207.26]|uniref:Zn(2)-C6 fungal-type domain-containing protein n=1 Tax=Zopfia rhizophila CBS 207.26 TaxID=1314779 RepID=A0A6A6DL80_9PEZI|nr:hypothetical protein K469DRAFT_673123 [Zopfia rhizophila CBS 207.26]